MTFAKVPDDVAASDMCLREIVDADGKTVPSFGVDQAADDTIFRGNAVHRRNRRAVGGAGDEDPTDRFGLQRCRKNFVALKHLAHTPGAALWLAYIGPQTGHDRAQSCPSKHPDGYREVPF